jgi:hypothetical protein
MSKPNALHRCHEPDVRRLVKLTAPERAKVYDAANLGLAERSMIEAEVRARIAGDFGRRR